MRTITKVVIILGLALACWFLLFGALGVGFAAWGWIK